MDTAKRMVANFIKTQERSHETPLQGGYGSYYILLCTMCFHDEGLRLTAEPFGIETDQECPHCGSIEGLKLDLPRLQHLVHTFFSDGTMQRADFGGAPVLISNEHQKNSIQLAPWSGNDLELLCKKTGLGVFSYGPRLWMLGENYPLKSLLKNDERDSIIQRIIIEYPSVSFRPGEKFYRMRVNPRDPETFSQYDSPPDEFCGSGRLDSTDFPVLYGSRDMQVCIHECRATAEDDVYAATLTATRELKLLDLTHILKEEDTSEFESLDMAVHLLFLARSQAYPITRELVRSASARGFDGLIYPSYFSLLRTGYRPFETVYGISIRKIPDLERRVMSQTIGNLALFGRPISEGMLSVSSLNRVVMSKAEYTLAFGPVGFTDTWQPDPGAE